MGTREGSPAEPSQNLTLVSSGSHAAGNIPVARLCGVVGSPDLEKPEWLEGRREQERGERKLVLTAPPQMPGQGEVEGQIRRQERLLGGQQKCPGASLCPDDSWTQLAGAMIWGKGEGRDSVGFWLGW